ncbi:MAG: hypothetical protein DRI71_02120 [Bacteroidetes bacterium]|nr:MAG: hypothetical protein DRI71_02120 [Bacteroidota bacterium]
MEFIKRRPSIDGFLCFYNMIIYFCTPKFKTINK